MAEAVKNPLQNKTFQAMDTLFGYIFKIGEVIFDYITILFEVIGKLGNFGVKAFFKYIVGFFASILRFFEKAAMYLYKKLTFIRTILQFFINIARKVYVALGEIFQPIIEQFDKVSQYVIGFFLFVVCAVYYFVYKKNEEDAATEGKNADAIFVLEYLKFSTIFGKIGGAISGAVSGFFKFFAIIAYSILIGLFSVDIKKAFVENYNYINDTIKSMEITNGVIVLIMYVLYIPVTILYILYTFLISTAQMLYVKMRNFSGPIVDDPTGTEGAKHPMLTGTLMAIIEKLGAIIKFIGDKFVAIYNHFSSIWEMPWTSFLYVIASSIIYVAFLYKLYFWGSDDLTKIAGNNHLYYYFVTSYLFFIAPLVYLLLKLPQQAYTGLIMLGFGSVSLLLMYVSNYYMNYRKSVGMKETPEQESDRNTYNMLYVIYSAVMVFFVNFKILKPNFDQSTIFLYTLLNVFFIAALIGYSISYKIKLTNRINKAAEKTQTPPPEAVAGVLTPEMTAYVRGN